MVILVVVASDMVACGGRKSHRKTLGHIADDQFILPNPRLGLCLSFWRWGEVTGGDEVVLGGLSWCHRS